MVKNLPAIQEKSWVWPLSWMILRREWLPPRYSSLGNPNGPSRFSPGTKPYAEIHGIAGVRHNWVIEWIDKSSSHRDSAHLDRVLVKYLFKPLHSSVLLHIFQFSLLNTEKFIFEEDQPRTICARSLLDQFHPHCFTRQVSLNYPLSLSVKILSLRKVSKRSRQHSS